MSEKQMCKKMFYSPQQGMENSLQEAHLRAASSVSSCSALQKISSASRSLMNLPTVVLCPETEILLRFTGGILFLSHGAKQNRKDGQPPFCKDNAPPLPLTHHASDFYILLGLISFVKGKRKKKNPQQDKTKQKKETWNSFEDKEGEAGGRGSI